jgi:hypothetical protein
MDMMATQAIQDIQAMGAVQAGHRQQRRQPLPDVQAPGREAQGPILAVMVAKILIVVHIPIIPAQPVACPAVAAAVRTNLLVQAPAVMEEGAR